MSARSVVFDLFGTLVDSFSASEYEDLLRGMGVAIGAEPEEFLRAWYASSDRRAVGAHKDIAENVAMIARRLGLSPTGDEIAAAVRPRMEFVRRAIVPRADAIATLAKLRERGLRIGLISDCSPEVPGLWRETEMAALVDAALFSPECGCKKPDPRIYRMACERLQVAPDECIYIGDGGSGELTGATAAGMRAIMIRVPYQDEDAHRLGAEEWDGETIASLSEVPGIVRSAARVGER
jgi:putative hydrolase of the HAD superfamily